MKYLDFKKLPETQFKRYTGISWSTFDLIVESMKKQIPTKGRPTKLCIEDQFYCVSAIGVNIALYFMSPQLLAFQSQRLQELYAMLKTA